VVYNITEIQGVGIKQITVQGIPIRVKGFEFLDLFITQADGTYSLARRGFSRKELEGKYVVSEVTTGLNLFGAFDSPEEAHHEVSTRLHDKGVERMRHVVELKRQQLYNMDF